MTPSYNRALDDKYEIVRQIKQGGFGIVYYGIDKKLNKPVAIKEIAPNLLDDPKYLDMFQEEALNIAKLSHNNIVHIYELKKTSDRHLFIIMEFIDGIDLEKIIRNMRKSERPIPPHLAVYIIAEICMALDYAHQRRDAFTNKPLNLVHQDISPSNIMISRDGGVKLIDFGIASVRRHRKEKKDNKLRGKIPYMAPEQLIMGNHPDHRSDLFSLGLVLFESITGDRLFNSQEEVITAGKNPKWFRKVLKGRRVPSSLGKILMRSLEIDLAKRYQTANHMYIDLLQYLISCNETGELMDDLADYLSDQFEKVPPLVTPTGYVTGTSGIGSPPNYQTPGSYYRQPTNLSPLPDINLDTPQVPSPNPNNLSNHFPPGGSLDGDSNYDLDDESAAENAHLSPAFRPALTKDVEPQPLQQQFPSNFKTMELDIDGGEELKTVIDVVRMSGKDQKKTFFRVALGFLFLVILALVFDTIYGWTRVGIWTYDQIFPPAIEIDTMPSGAQLFLDNKQLDGRTPYAIDEISPGVHKLELTLPGRAPVVKSLFVPREGAITVKGGAESKDSRKYLFRFTTEIAIDSAPQGAEVYVNGVRFSQKTPCKFAWEVGAQLAIELRKNNFETLSGYVLNTEEGYDEVEDRRLWKLKVYDDTYTHFAVTGIFRKNVSIETVPPGAEIVDAKTERVLGIAGRGIRLPIGNHEVIVRMSNFIPQKRTIRVDESGSEELRVVLSRRLRFTAVDDQDGTRRDIGATLLSLKRNNRETLRASRTTPVEINLPAFAYSAIFTKPGYQRAQVRVTPGAQTVTVEMKQLKASVQVVVMDALSERPIVDAEIYASLAGSQQAQGSRVAQTDSEGTGLAQLSDGNYEITVKKAGYQELSRQVLTRIGEPTTLEFKIYPSN